MVSARKEVLNFLAGPWGDPSGKWLKLVKVEMSRPQDKKAHLNLNQKNLLSPFTASIFVQSCRPSRIEAAEEAEAAGANPTQTPLPNPSSTSVETSPRQATAPTAIDATLHTSSKCTPRLSPRIKTPRLSRTRGIAVTTLTRLKNTTRRLAWRFGRLRVRLNCLRGVMMGSGGCGLRLLRPVGMELP